MELIPGVTGQSAACARWLLQRPHAHRHAPPGADLAPAVAYHRHDGTAQQGGGRPERVRPRGRDTPARHAQRSEEHTSELQSLMRISFAVFCLKQKHKDCLYSSTSITSPFHQYSL